MGCCDPATSGDGGGGCAPPAARADDAGAGPTRAPRGDASASASASENNGIFHPPLHLRRIQDADLTGKVVLVRVDHNCVKGGQLKDAFRVDASLATLYNIVERGGRPILMSHVNRPKDKKTKRVAVDDADAVAAVARYLTRKLGVVFACPEFRVVDGDGIVDIDTSVNWLIEDLRARRVGGVYLPNTRWFLGEEAGEGSEAATRFATQLAGLADVFVNDAFGSWQPHVSTLGVAKFLPSYAGLLMQRECEARSIHWFPYDRVGVVNADP